MAKAASVRVPGRTSKQARLGLTAHITAPIIHAGFSGRITLEILNHEPFTTYAVRVYDWPQRKAQHTFFGHVGQVTALRFSPDGNSLASGAQDTSVLCGI